MTRFFVPSWLTLALASAACSSSSTHSTASGGTAGTTTGGAAGSLSGGSGGSGGTSAGGGTGGTNVEANCSNVKSTCGADGKDDCCRRGAVPAEAFSMGRSTAGGDAYPAGDANEVPEHVVTPMAVELDVYEVTLSRFRLFAKELPESAPKSGAGEHPGVPGSGWKSEWDPVLNVTAIDAMFQCGFRSVWRVPQLPENDKLPINCVSWFWAFAFCAWDGGFLPTEAEWEAAAAGSSENRIYPWGGQTPEAGTASLDCEYDGNPACDFTDITVPGANAKGVGRFGHHDLGGSMWEWTLDAFDPGFYTAGSCTGCANLVGDTRVLRGGGWQSLKGDLRAARRNPEPPSYSSEETGIRCARLK